MATKEQMTLWELEYLKATASDSTLSYIMKYVHTENPFVDEAIVKLSQTEISSFQSLYNYNIYSCRLTRQDFIWAKDFCSCKTQKDYEKYFIKYNGDKNNPYLYEVKNQIKVRNSISLIWRLLIMLLALLMSGGLIYLGWLGDGTSNTFIALVCCACILGAFALFICSIVFVCSPNTFIQKK